jgi:RND family efflux transporter MFP subunit
MAKDSPRRIGPAVLVAGLLVVAAALVLGYFLRPRPLAVHTAAVEEAPDEATARTVLNASGYVTARLEATVSSKVTGKVTEVLIEEGTQVASGQVLARLDATNVQASLLLAEAQLQSARTAIEETQAQSKEAEQDLARQASLLNTHVAAQADFDHAEAAALAYRARLARQQADVTVAERTVEVWRQQCDDMVIRAPFDGVVTSKNAQPGEMISPMSAGGFTRTGICTIVAMNSREIEIDVNESYINRVEPGEAVEATLDAYPDWKIPCRVIAIIPTADRDKSTVKVRVGFDRLDPRILPEMGVKVAFLEAGGAGPGGGARAVLVPKTAVQSQDGRDIVMVIHNGRAERRAVKVLNVGADQTSIAAGLSAGERVAVDWPAGLADGVAVQEISP